MTVLGTRQEDLNHIGSPFAALIVVCALLFRSASHEPRPAVFVTEA